MSETPSEREPDRVPEEERLGLKELEGDLEGREDLLGEKETEGDIELEGDIEYEGDAESDCGCATFTRKEKNRTKIPSICPARDNELRVQKLYAKYHYYYCHIIEYFVLHSNTSLACNPLR